MIFKYLFLIKDYNSTEEDSEKTYFKKYEEFSSEKEYEEFCENFSKKNPFQKIIGIWKIPK